MHETHPRSPGIQALPLKLFSDHIARKREKAMSNARDSSTLKKQLQVLDCFSSSLTE
jgi:hypothetical protein